MCFLRLFLYMHKKLFLSQSSNMTLGCFNEIIKDNLVCVFFVVFFLYGVIQRKYQVYTYNILRLNIYDICVYVICGPKYSWRKKTKSENNRTPKWSKRAIGNNSRQKKI